MVFPKKKQSGSIRTCRAIYLRVEAAWQLGGSRTDINVQIVNRPFSLYKLFALKSSLPFYQFPRQLPYRFNYPIGVFFCLVGFRETREVFCDYVKQKTLTLLPSASVASMVQSTYLYCFPFLFTCHKFSVTLNSHYP